MPPEESIRKAIDEAVGPLIADHRTYLFTNGPLLATARAELLYVFDQYSTQLLDFSADMAPVGHCHPAVVDAIKEHLLYYLRTAPVNSHVLRWPVEYAKKISDTFSDEDESTPLKVWFTEGEREAVHAAVNIARNVSGRDKIAMVDTECHMWYSQQNHAHISLLPLEDFFIDQFRWDTVGALLLSLVHANGTWLDKKWVQDIVDKAYQNDVPVIIDESRTGFGRTGHMWAQQAYSIDPHFTVLGGPVGGGLALGAVVADKYMFKMNCGDPGEDFESIQSSAQAGSPIACAAGAATLKAINVGVLEHTKDAGHALGDGLGGLANQFPEYIAATHGDGLLHTLEFQSKPYARAFEADARKHGLLVSAPYGTNVVLTPPLIASEMEIKRGVDLMSEVFIDWAEQDLR